MAKAQTPRLRNLAGKAKAAKTAGKPESADQKNVNHAHQAGKPEPGPRPSGDEADTRERPISEEKQIETAQEERARTMSTDLRVDGTTPRHTEPLGPPAPGQQGRPGPERRVFPNNGVMPVDRSEEVEAAAKREKGKRIRVAAVRMGYYDHARRRPGDVFDVYEADFSDRWMETVDGSTPIKITTPKQALKAHHDERLAGRVADRQLGDKPARRSDVNPLGDDD